LAEVAFETMRMALEAVRGTGEAAPTHLLNVEGTLVPKITRYRPKEQRGTLAEVYRSVDTRKWAEFEGKGDLDVNELTFWLNMAVAPLGSPSTPSSAVLARLWAFTRNISSDTIKSATAWWGDPALNQLTAPFAMLDELTIENDSSGEEVATISVKGMANFPSKVAAPGATASIAGATLPGQLMQCWIDTGSAIGTTAISGRLISAKHTIKTGASYKYIAGGPAASLSYALSGRQKASAIETELKLELIDFTQYDLWAAGTALKVRVRHNGALIESVAGPLNFYNYVEVDTYGPLDELDWDDNEGTNRALTVKIVGQYDSTLGSDLRVGVQNACATL